jgi:DNA-binding NtrC family response regulator
VYPSLESAQLVEVVGLARRVACSPATPVLIISEPGGGAEELARLIHDATPGAPHMQFVAVRCRGVAEDVIERDLFGERDARAAQAAPAVERARPGTLFIDEVSHLAETAQARLATFIDAEHRRAPDGGSARQVRVIAGTEVSLGHAVRERRFRSDLFEQLSVMKLRIPPLRERPQDILPLARKLLDGHAKRLGKDIRDLAPAAAAKLRDHVYPGNVRELDAIIERAVILESGDTLDAGSISFEDEAATGALTFLSVMVSRFSEEHGRPPKIVELERAYVVWLLERTRGNRTAVSRILGVSYPTIMKKIIDYGIDLESIVAAARSGGSTHRGRHR